MVEITQLKVHKAVKSGNLVSGKDYWNIKLYQSSGIQIKLLKADWGGYKETYCSKESSALVGYLHFLTRIIVI